MAGLIPIPNQNSVIPSRVRKWDWDSRPAEDSNASKATSSLVESKWWVIIEAPNLILNLKCVGEILAWGNGTCGSIHSILVWISPQLYSTPVYLKNQKSNIKTHHKKSTNMNLIHTHCPIRLILCVCVWLPIWS